jgi:hypothetical protein
MTVKITENSLMRAIRMVQNHLADTFIFTNTAERRCYQTLDDLYMRQMYRLSAGQKQSESPEPYVSANERKR